MSAEVPNPNDDGPGIRVGRYLLHRQIARGGMATIHIARLMGDEGFSRIVAAKRLLPEFVEDQDFLTMFLDEARVASKVQHRNVVPVLDVVTAGDEVILVQEYVHGAPLNKLLGIANKAKEHIPVPIAVALVSQVLAGLQAAHDTTDEIGMPLNIVHRDVSPQNIMVSVDGTARLLDFGVAKATMAAHITRENAFKGKIAYSAPEQLHGQATQQSDVYSLAVVLWELVVGHRMHHKAQAEMEIVAKIIAGDLPSIVDAMAEEKAMIAKERWAQIEAVDAVVKKGLAIAVHERWLSAAAMEAALVEAVPPASSSVVKAWLKTLGKELLEKNDRMLAAEEASWRRTSVHTGGRLTPLPGEPRRQSGPTAAAGDHDDPTQASQPSHSRTGRGSVAAAAADAGIGTPTGTPTGAPNERRGRVVLFGLLGGILAALIVVIFVLANGSGGRIPVVAPAPLPTMPAPLPAAVAPVPIPVPVVPAAPVGQVTAPGAPPVAPPAPVAAEPVKPTPVAVPTRPHPAPAVVRPAVQTRPTAAATPATTASPPAPAKCDPPYFFDGPKKVFKPECL